MAGPAHRSAFRDALGQGCGRCFIAAPPSVGDAGPDQALGAVRAVEARSEERLLRNELDADEFAMASLVDAVALAPGREIDRRRTAGTRIHGRRPTVRGALTFNAATVGWGFSDDSPVGRRIVAIRAAVKQTASHIAPMRPAIRRRRCPVHAQIEPAQADHRGAAAR